MIYFVNTIYLDEGTYSEVDKESPEYKTQFKKIMADSEAYSKQKEENKKQFREKYPEFIEAWKNQSKENEFYLKYGDFQDFEFYEKDSPEGNYYETAELELEKEIFEKTGEKVQIRGDYVKYLCYTLPQPCPTYDEYCQIYETYYDGPSIDSIEAPQIEQDVFFITNERTPIMFNNLEEAKKFVENNECDWEECGYYNYADIQGVVENVSYPSPDSNQCITHTVFSTEEGWVESKTVSFNYWYALEIQGKKVLRRLKNHVIGYNGTVEIG